MRDYPRRKVLLLGNVAWKTKIFVRTRDDLSMEMHSNERKSVSTCPRRPKAEAFDNGVDVVELLLAPTGQVPNVRHLRVLHTQ